MKKNFSRLPSYIQPERYQLTVKPDLNGFTFAGEEIIYLHLEKAVKEITLHAKELKVSDVFYKLDDFRLKATKVIYNEKDETVTLKFSTNLHVGKGEIHLKFAGVLNNNMRGFYRSRYTHGGKEKHMATTQFEATDARRAFPCFDEPAQKAIFDVSLIVPNDLTAISNTIETSIVQEHEAGYKLVKFAPSPKMSTYLLAFIVGDFEFIENKTKDGVLVRVFVTPGKKHQATFALDTAIKCLEFYNKYFDIPYPLPVLDLIAIPDFSHGAMENWGAVTYRETALLVDPELTSAANKQWVALVIAHELAHQWFGNLVTMEWWTHLWLNEGFASYIEYLAVDHVFPSWDIWTQFAYADMGVAFRLDALKNTHPIEIEVGHPDEIGEIFDEISYSKGASVIRMLAGYLGEENFRDGLRYYLKKHSYKNASTIHLWEAFEKISKKPVRKIMAAWTSQPGYPVLKVSQKPKALTVTQSRFYSSPVSKKQSKEETLWPVPVNASDFKTTKNFLLTKKVNEIPFSSKKAIKLNLGESGFYRIDYPSQMVKELHPLIESKKLSAIDRLALIRDAFALAEAGEFPTTQVLELLPAYKNETDYTVWIELLSGLSNLRSLLYGKKLYPKFQEFAKSVLKNISKDLGMSPKKGESHTTGMLRSLVLSQLISLKDESITEQAIKIYKSGKAIPADIRSVVYQAAAQNGSQKTHSEFIKKYKTESMSEEKNRIARALTQFSDENLLKLTLDFALSEQVRIQDTPQVFGSLWANVHARNLVWEFTKKNWKTLNKNYPSSGHMLNRFVKPAAVFSTKKDLENIKKFFQKNKAPSIKRAIEQTLEKIQSNILWLERDEKALENWLNK